MLKKVLLTGAIALGLLIPLMGQAIAAPADANEAITNAQTAADTAFMLMSAALVLLMTPGLDRLQRVVLLSVCLGLL